MNNIVINLDKFKIRDYQLPVFDAIENKGYKKVISVLPRRCGKDLSAFNFLIRSALRRVGTYWHCLPTQAQARKVIWDAITSDGNTFLSYIPEQLIASKNSSLMMVKLVNGSVIQLVGSNNYDSLRGTNAIGIIFSEYSTSDPRAYPVIRPVLNANDGWVIFLSTPSGKNHLYELFKIAQQNPNDWFAYKLTVEDTKHISVDQINKEIESGEMSYDLAMQEYYTSWDLGVEGAYYTRIINGMRLNNQITTVLWNPEYKVHTAWDLGFSDPTVIVFFQVIGSAINVIDYYSKPSETLSHFANYVLSKPYTYGTHIFPHDVNVHGNETGLTRLHTFAQLGINGIVAPQISINDGIEKVRQALPRMFIDEVRCKDLLKSLENYRQSYDATNHVYSRTPRHDWSSHCADAVRYMCVSLNLLQSGLTEDQIDQYKHEALKGTNPRIPNVLQQPTQWY